MYNIFAAGIYLHDDQNCHEKLVGHSPIELSFLLCKSLEREGCPLTLSPTGPRVLEDGLVITGTYTALYLLRRQLDILKEQLEKEALTLNYLKLDIGRIRSKNIIHYH